MKHVDKEHAQHLVHVLNQHYNITTDWEGKKYIGLTLNWEYEKREVRLLIPGYVKGMYVLPPAGLLVQQLLEERLNKEGYRQSTILPGLYKHNWRPIQFTLVVDDFGVYMYIRVPVSRSLSTSSLSRPNQCLHIFPHTAIGRQDPLRASSGCLTQLYSQGNPSTHLLRP